MRLFFDCEFREDGHVIDFISIGAVREDGAEYYAVSRQFNMWKAKRHEWLAANVLPKLPPKPWDLGEHDSPRLIGESTAWKNRETIAQDLIEFFGDSPEIWADYCSYDWVSLCQLFGPMISLPKTWPMFCRDIQQLKGRLKIELPESENEHHALFDARNVRDRYNLLIHSVLR